MPLWPNAKCRKPWPEWAPPTTPSRNSASSKQPVAKEEATAKAFDQLASAGKDDDLEAQFAALGNHGVDNELAALKAERQGKKLPPSMPKELAQAGAPMDKAGA